MKILKKLSQEFKVYGRHCFPTHFLGIATWTTKRDRECRYSWEKFSKNIGPKFIASQNRNRFATNWSLEAAEETHRKRFPPLPQRSTQLLGMANSRYRHMTDVVPLTPTCHAEWPISRPLGHRFSTGRRPWGRAEALLALRFCFFLSFFHHLVCWSPFFATSELTECQSRKRCFIW